MKKIALLAGLAAISVLAASCSHGATSSLLPATAPQSGPPEFQRAASAAAVANVPSGWAATATQGISKLRAGKPATGMAVNQPLRVVVGLAMRDPKGAQDAVRRQFAPGGAAFHTFMTPAQFTARFNPTRSQAESVAAYLRRQGFTHVEIAPNNLIVTGTGSIARAQSAFHTTIETAVADGKVVYGNTSPALVPAKFKGLVLAVLGLNNTNVMRTHLRKSTHAMQPATAGSPPPCFQVVNGVCEIGEYGPHEYQVAYDASAAQCSNLCSGSRTSIAIMAEGDVSSVLGDLRKAEAFWGLPQVPYTVRKVGVSSADTAGADEWDMDTQISSGFAQTVKMLYVYDTTSLTDSDTTVEFNKWVTDDLAPVASASFGGPESLSFADGSMMLADQIFNQAAAQGQTMFASTGDNGEGCPVVAATGVPNTSVPEVCYPAASPYVVAVGGTTLDTNAAGDQPGSYYGEHVWIGTGGGYSKWETAPYWQSNGICGAGCVVGRGMADIAMCADNNGCPMDVFVGGVQEGVGGTSLSSPMSAGLWARLQSHFKNTLGFAAPVYYGVYAHYEPCALGSTACVPAGEPGSNTAALAPDTTAPVGGFHDILIGTNGVPSVAGPGWDTPTGLGSIDYAVMQKDITNSDFSGL